VFLFLNYKKTARGEGVSVSPISPRDTWRPPSTKLYLKFFFPFSPREILFFKVYKRKDLFLAVHKRKVFSTLLTELLSMFRIRIDFGRLDPDPDPDQKDQQK
jgi:hypothetical protein